MSVSEAGISYAMAFATACVLKKTDPEKAGKFLGVALANASKLLENGPLETIETALSEAPADFVYEHDAVILSAAVFASKVGMKMHFADPDGPLDGKVLSVWINFYPGSPSWEYEWTDFTELSAKGKGSELMLPSRFALPGNDTEFLADTALRPSVRLEMNPVPNLVLEIPSGLPEHLRENGGIVRIFSEYDPGDAEWVNNRICDCRVAVDPENPNVARLVPVADDMMTFSAACINRTFALVASSRAKRFPKFLMPSPVEGGKVRVSMIPEGLAVDDFKDGRKFPPYLCMIPIALAKDLAARFWWFDADPDYELYFD